VEQEVAQVNHAVTAIATAATAMQDTLGGIADSTVRAVQAAKDGVAHAVQELLVRRADRGEGAAAGGGFFPGEKIRAEADAAAQWFDGVRFGIPEFGVEQGARVEFLE
jgi:hypothetical protein